MPYKIIKTIDVRYLQILDESGSADPTEASSFSDDQLKAFFKALLQLRIYNDLALSLQREGRIGTYPSYYGQEAAQAGSALAMEREDWLFPSFRETGVYLLMGLPAANLFRYWLGDERGMKIPEGINVMPMSVPVGSHIPHATGTAMAMKYKKKKQAAVAYFGDGASSRGDFHEALNMAGVYKAPAVFICMNNQWAISLPRSAQCAGETIAQRAYSYGFEGLQVDGNDVLAVYKATKDALDKAKDGGGPTLIECVTYRLGNHTTADDASRYRDEAELAKWTGREPLKRFRIYLKERGIWSEDYEKEISAGIRAGIDKSIKEAEAMDPPELKDIILNTNAEQSPRQVRELEETGWLK
ncbi:Branched-chain alpha-keto acid dehydrogenase, E1 component, alpha subunit [hydrothermal vent metagenome]|uniref:Branched-chain alpha-keto acid dehydrogenase, E1 component, alpha subunit n=1 Tax=hydrothermal vent metagenome TaxID=652676 RepID=A0A3B0QVW5_9ZZZZ